jgi:pyrroline-5-carboxylate reductase
MRIAFVGGGHMTTSLVGGLRARGTDPGAIVVSDPVAAQLERLARDYGVGTASDNATAVAGADVVVLAVKPQDMAAAAREVAAALRHARPVVVSIAAGIRLADLARWLGAEATLVRTMPNRPALIGAGITAAYAPATVPAAARARASAVLEPAGPVVWLDEEAQMDAVTAVSGSGPAYFFQLIEMMEAAGVELGLSKAVARQLAVQTALGSGRMAAESGEPPDLLRQQVTSKGGTTAAALAVLEGAGVRRTYAAAIAAAARRSAELADQFGGT